MSSKSDTLQRAKILVSDDDQNVRLLTRQCLEAEDMIVVEAANGPETIDVFVRERPDLVFLDVEMPGMSGLEVCRRIRQMPQGESIPIMIVTGSDDRQSIDQGFEAGATQYKTKPVNWSLLGNKIQIDNSGALVDTMAQFVDKIEPYLTDTDRTRILAHKVLSGG